MTEPQECLESEDRDTQDVMVYPVWTESADSTASPAVHRACHVDYPVWAVPPE